MRTLTLKGVSIGVLTALFLLALPLSAQITSTSRIGWKDNDLRVDVLDADSLIINDILPFPADSGNTDQALVWTGGKIQWATVTSGDTVVSGTDTVIIAKIVTDLDAGEWSGQWLERTAGETVKYGQAVYAEPADHKVYRALACTEDSMPAIGIVISPDSVLADSVAQVLISGAYCDTSLSLTTDVLVYVDTLTPGLVTTNEPANAGHVGVVIGNAVNDTTVLININLNMAVASGRSWTADVDSLRSFADSAYADINANLSPAEGGALVADSLTAYTNRDSTRNKVLRVNGLADSTGNGMTFSDIAGENLTFGDVVYWRNDSLWLCNGDTVGATYKGPPAAMSIDKTTAAGAVGQFLISGVARAEGWINLPISGPAYVDTIPGGQLSRYAPTVAGMASWPVAVTIDSTAGKIQFNANFVTTVK